MSRASVKSAGRASKAAAGTRKKVSKSAKSARKSVKKPSASASRRSAKPVRAAKTPVKPVAVHTVIASMVAESAIMRMSSPPVQPAAPEIVSTHKYRVGETVYYTSPSFGRAAASGSYTVVKLLPSDGDDCQYRIKSSGEAFERVAKESQLDRA
jgi:hypothetical protein